MKKKVFLNIFLVLIVLSIIVPVGLVVAFGPVLDSNYNFDSDFSNNLYSSVYTNNSSAQTFTIGTRDVTVSSIKVYGKRTLLPGSTNLSIYAVNGSGYPTGSILTSGTLNASTWGTSPEWVDFDVTDLLLSANTKYALCLRSNGGTVANYTGYGTDDTSTSYTGGGYFSSTDNGSTWTSNTSRDLGFEVYGYISNAQNFYSSSDDGELYNNNATYATCRTSATGTVNDLDISARVGQDNVSSINWIYRTSLFFDTSSLPDGATITGAKLYFYGKTDSSTTNFNMTVVDASNIGSPMISGDYYAVYEKSTSLGTLSTASYTTGVYNSITLSSTGLLSISRVGDTKLALRSDRDIAGTTPTGAEYVLIYTGEMGSGYAPYLAVEYTEPSGLANPDYLTISSVKVFSNYDVSGDKLFCVLYNVEYSAGPPAQNPGDYFDIQLISGATVIAQTGIPNWGMSPGSIYLGANNSITLGGDYQIRIMGSNLYSSPMYYTYDIGSGDWVGSAMGLLDNWVKSSANVISDYYNVAMSEYFNSKWVLNDYGGALFIAGIPGLDDQRPGLFKGINVDFSGGNESNADYTYANTLNSSTSLGAKTQAALNALGVTLGVGGTFFGGFFWGFIMLVVCGVIVLATGNSLLGLVMSIIILICGVVLGVIPPVFIAVFGLVCAAGMLYVIWGKTA